MAFNAKLSINCFDRYKICLRVCQYKSLTKPCLVFLYLHQGDIISSYGVYVA